MFRLVVGGDESDKGGVVIDAGVVSAQPGVDGAGDATFETQHGRGVGASRFFALQVVLLAGCTIFDLGHGDLVAPRVDLPVAAFVGALAAAGGSRPAWDGGGAGTAGERCFAFEPGDV